MVQIQRLIVSLSQGCRGQIKRNHTKPFPNVVRGEPRTAFLYISEEEYANEPQDHKKGGYELYKQYGCERYVEMLRIINEAWKGNVDAYLAGVIRGVARFISVYEGEYSRERLVQQLARTHPKTPSRSWLRKTPEVLQTATCGRSFVSITVPAVR